jgi:putative intracellular protease/amidase
VTIAFVLYPGFTALDIIGPFEVLAFVPGHDAVFVAAEPGPVTDDTGRCQLIASTSLKLERRGARYTGQRVVETGTVITAAGVSAGIDMALTLLARLHGPQIAQGLQLAIEYDPQPPFDTGSPSKAPAEMVEFVRSQLTTLAAAEPATSG